MNIENNILILLFGLLSYSMEIYPTNVSMGRQTVVSCSDDDFDPKCSTNEVIVIESAIYGRMEFGKCLQYDDLAEKLAGDQKFLNCSVDAKDFLDSKCSGKQNCVVRVNNQELLNRSSCYKSIPHYLEVKYSCICRNNSQAMLYCTDVYFDPKCSTNEVIVIESAIYGRVEFGKCLQYDDLAGKLAGDQQFLNCSVDVKDFLDSKCSGKHNCVIRVNNQELLNRSSCYKSIPHYLEVKYSCIYGPQTGSTPVSVSARCPQTDLITTTQPTVPDTFSTTETSDISVSDQSETSWTSLQDTARSNGDTMSTTSHRELQNYKPTTTQQTIHGRPFTPEIIGVNRTGSTNPVSLPPTIPKDDGRSSTTPSDNPTVTRIPCTSDYSDYCQNGGTCFFDPSSGPTCSCHSNSTGLRCELQNLGSSVDLELASQSSVSSRFALPAFVIIFIFLLVTVVSCYVCMTRPRTRRRTTKPAVGGVPEDTVQLQMEERLSQTTLNAGATNIVSEDLQNSSVELSDDNKPDS